MICVCAVCARSANILRTERKSNNKLSKCKRKTPCHGSSKKTSKKHRLGSQNVSKNRPWRPPGAPWPPPARDFRAKSSPKALLEASRGGKRNLGTSKGAPGRNFQRDWQKSGIKVDSVGGVGGDLGQARLGSKIPNTLITASGGRRTVAPPTPPTTLC